MLLKICLRRMDMNHLLGSVKNCEQFLDVSFDSIFYKVYSKKCQKYFQTIALTLVKTTVGLWAAATTIGIIGYKYAYRDYQRDIIEMRSARHAILPMLIAERDRA